MPILSYTHEGFQRVLEVTRAMTGELDLPRLLQTILDSAVGITGAERGCLMVEPDDCGSFGRILYHHLDPTRMEAAEFEPARAAIQRVRTERQGVRLSDSESCPLTPHGADLQGLRSLLCEPLVVRDALLGVLYLDNTGVCNLFTPEQQELLEALAAQAAVSLENARLFRHVQQSARQHLEDQLRARELETRRQLMSTFVSIAAHDLKNPLAALKGGVYVLERLAIPDPGPETLATMSQSIQLATRLIQNYLEFARLDGDEEIRLVTRRVDLQGLVDRELALLGARLSSEEFARFDFQTQIDPGLAVEADEGRLEQILANLVDNAVKYSPNGGRIQVRAERRPSGVALEVVDSGVGISPEEQADLFGRFTRLPSMAEATRGTGLGLWITRRLVDLHGWDLEVESEVGRGTTFRILAPESATT